MPACAEISRLPTKATVHAGIQIPTPKSTTKDGGASDAVNKEKRTVRDRMQLGSIFSRESDIHRAYNTIVYMLELQKSNIEAINPRAYQQIASLSNLLQEIKTVQAAAKLIIPRVSEINYALDLLHQTSENYYTVLKNYREKQYMLECEAPFLAHCLWLTNHQFYSEDEGTQRRKVRPRISRPTEQVMC